jgi:hypothetical protein
MAFLRPSGVESWNNALKYAMTIPSTCFTVYHSQILYNICNSAMVLN